MVGALASLSKTNTSSFPVILSTNETRTHSPPLFPRPPPGIAFSRRCDLRVCLWSLRRPIIQMPVAVRPLPLRRPSAAASPPVRRRFAVRPSPRRRPSVAAPPSVRCRAAVRTVRIRSPAGMAFAFLSTRYDTVRAKATFHTYQGPRAFKLTIGIRFGIV